MSSEERAVWVDAPKAELASVDELEVHGEVNPEEVEMVQSLGVYPKRLPARLLLVKKRDKKDHE
eukprot:12751131-Prorocentrum_lima.AAC.1